MRKGTEIISVELKIGQQKFIFCTVYRVGTLGEINHNSIIDSIRSFYGGRMNRNIFIVGDLNLNTIQWPLQGVTDSVSHIDHMFLDSFFELGLQQLINCPTHNKGRVLDLLLTNKRSAVTDIKVLDKEVMCKSDHYPITFSVKFEVNRLKPCKREVYNFKRANWDQLNRDIGTIDWPQFIDCLEPELANLLGID